MAGSRDRRRESAASPGTGGVAMRETPVAAETPAPLTRQRARKGRASVPSWDEIVFGAKPE